jgi:succinate dehydrogenase / fumarate reductase membrane anchor subunit
MTAPLRDSRTPLGRVRGLGSARSGTTHFWHQRMTSVAGVGLTIAFVVIAMSAMGRNHAAVKQILGAPPVALLLLLFVVNTTYHMWLGMQVIIEDYVHHELGKLALLMVNTFFSIVVGLVCCYALFKLSFGV